MLDKIGDLTPPTQWITRAHVTLRVVADVFLAASGGRFPGGDAVPDGDLLGSDKDVFDQQAQHSLPLADAGVGGVAAQLGEEAFEVVGELEVGVAVGSLGIDGFELAAQVLLAGAQVRHPGAQFVDGDQLLLECLDHRGDRGSGFGQRQFEAVPLLGDRIGGAGGVQPLADLGADQRGVGEQPGDVVPYDGIEVVGADRLVVADPAVFVAVVVGSQAPVVVDLVARCGGRVAAVVAVPAARAGGQALQQGRDFAVAGGEPLVVCQPLLHPAERVTADDRGDRDLGPFLAGPVNGLDCPRCVPPLQPGDPVQPGRFVDGLGLAEHGAALVAGIAQHPPDHRPVPAMLAGPGEDAPASQPAAQVGDGGTVVGVAAEHLRHQHRLMVDDLVAGARFRGLADVPVAERGAAQHVHRPGAGPVGLAAPVPLHQLGLLVLGEHALELDQQLVFGAVAARPVDELHPGSGPVELLDQQRLVGELAGQPVRRITQDRINAALSGQVPQGLQRRAHQCGTGVPLILEHPALGDLKPQPPGVLAHRLCLRSDRLVLLLPGAGYPGVDRRAGHLAAVLPGQPAPGGPAAAAPISRRPPTHRWPHAGRRRTPSRLPGRSPAGMVPVTPLQELLQGLGHHLGEGAPRLPGMLADRRSQPPRQLDGEHHARLGHRHRATRDGLVHIPAGLADRAPEPPSKAACGLRRRHTRPHQISSRVDPLGVLHAIHPPRHAINILPEMSSDVAGAPAQPISTGPAPLPVTARSTTRWSAPCRRPARPASPRPAGPRRPARSRPARPPRSRPAPPLAHTPAAPPRPAQPAPAVQSPATLPPPVTQRDFEAVVANCVGGVITPVLANLALSVLDESIAQIPGGPGNTQGQRAVRRRRGQGNYRLVRYADDWLLMVSGTREHAEQMREHAAAVLAPVGLRLSAEKTKITHIDEGLDFLGWRIQRHRKRGTSRYYIYTYPSRKAVKAVTAKVKTIFRRNVNLPLQTLIRQLNPALRGWCAYFRPGVSAATFADLARYTRDRFWRWARRKHRRITVKTIRRRYCNGGRWPVTTETALLNPDT